MPSELELVYVNETNQVIDQPAISEFLRRTLQRLLTGSSLQQPGSVGRLITEIVFVGDKKIQALNSQFRGVDAPTDVLSFNRPDDNPENAASIVISVETAARQAKQAGWSIDQELNMLANHGLLHILDYSHA